MQLYYIVSCLAFNYDDGMQYPYASNHPNSKQQRQRQDQDRLRTKSPLLAARTWLASPSRMR